MRLTDNTEIDFYLNFDWNNIDCEDALIYESVPAELVPEHITTFVKKNYVHNYIQEIAREPQGGWKIELNNNMIFMFDGKYNLTGIENKY